MLIGKIKTWLAGFFYFNKQERNGVFLLCLILALLVLLRLLLPGLLRGQRPEEIFLPEREVPALSEAPEEPKPQIHKQEGQESVTGEKFVFNPNTMSEEDALALGFSKKLSNTLVNFRNKGGKFFKADDLKKLYGMSPELYASLEDYVLIPNNRPAFHRDTAYAKPYPRQSFPKSLLELNSADSLAIVYLKGIGPGFTKRILKYRALLGGFHSAEQLKEIYGMSDSTYAILTSQIVIDKSLITKIPLNAIDLGSLKKHPYFNFQIAQAIINYRSKHGKLTEADLNGLGMIPAEKLALIRPYIEY